MAAGSVPFLFAYHKLTSQSRQMAELREAWLRLL
jgi:hypothetical protein